MPTVVVAAGDGEPPAGAAGALVGALLGALVGALAPLLTPSLIVRPSLAAAGER
jgi:hypothetical protein